ncbi:MAG: hypothetical protein RLZZ546_827 [Bacteroidota bacterium]
MNQIKKILGVVWLILAPIIVYAMVNQAVIKIETVSEMQRTNLILQWGIILTVFIPICVGFSIFGYYALKGEYSQKNY